MARTPLAHRLQGMVARAEMSARELEAGGRVEGAHTRRDFLRRAGAAGLGAAALTAFPGAQPHARGAPGPRIVIAGGGLAGLTAAYRLRQAGHAADVHDASSRLGGRCWTRRGGFVDDQLTERGGEFIDTGHREIRRLIRELGLALVDILAAEEAGTEPLHYFDGQPYTDAQATQDYREVRPALRRDVNAAGYPTTYRSSTARGRELDRTSVAEYIERVVPGGRGSRFGQLLELAYVTEYGGEAGDQSSLNLLYLLGYSSRQFEIFGESNQRFRIEGGNDRLVDALVKRLSRRIRRESELIAIERRPGGGYDLTFQQGLAVRTVRADRAILALPFSILRSSVDYSRAGFKPLKRTAIREQGMGANAKLAAQFSERRWEDLGCNGETFADTGYQSSWDASRGQAGRAGILLNYTGGAAAVGFTGHPDALARRFARQIDPVLPGIRPLYNGRAALDHWPSNPLTRGSYSFWKVGQYTRFAGVESEVEDECHFAGEHTSLDFQGYLNGAVQSGERAAEEVVAALGG
ncbi:MAG: flavin monoamine oxidase family protein [Solirubrobacterales bacterium]